ncbi:MAG: hypothetical protein Alpg2KO_18120 [Alphaproteobacteria bacterium]
MTRYILDIVDMQHDFMIPGAALPVADADKIIAPTNRFFKSIKPGTFDAALVKYDTHFPGEYKLSPESQAFPDIHCAYGTKGWDQVVDLKLLARRMPVRHMLKNVFDMWGTNPTGVKDVKFASKAERNAYNGLFTIKRNPHDSKAGTPRDEWMTRNGVEKDGATVVICGVASDFCVMDAMKGYLERGVNVIVLTDLTRGIGADPARSATGEISDVCARNFASYEKSGQLRQMTSDAFIKMAQPSGPNADAADKPDLTGAKP